MAPGTSLIKEGDANSQGPGAKWTDDSVRGQDTLYPNKETRRKQEPGKTICNRREVRKFQDNEGSTDRMKVCSRRGQLVKIGIGRWRTCVCHTHEFTVLGGSQRDGRKRRQKQLSCQKGCSNSSHEGRHSLRGKEPTPD